MKKTVLTFGLISGGLSAALLFVTATISDRLGFDKGEILGYTLIVLSALLIFFGVRSYRENASGGRLTFARGFAVGILITLISSVCYVASWEIAYFKFMPDFADKVRRLLHRESQSLRCHSGKNREEDSGGATLQRDL